MFVIVHTLKFPVTHGKTTYKDDYQLCDTMDEARGIVSRLISSRPHGLVNYAICNVVESSNPSWQSQPSVWGGE